MILIDPDGLFNGDRLRRCSNAAQLHWPRLFLASDGFGRLEINYARIIGRAYPTFNPLPSDAELQTLLQEYAKNYLLFLYEVDGRLWGQWDTRSEYLPRYKTSIDRRSPNPPEPAFTDWKKRYRNESRVFPKSSGKYLETFHAGAYAVAVAVAVAGAVAVAVAETPCSSDDERGAGSPLELTPPPPKQKPADEVKLWFDGEFWPVYPRKVAKPAALRAARHHGKTAANRATILDCLSRRLPALQEQFRADGDYRPYPATWLNQTPWMDPEEAEQPRDAPLTREQRKQAAIDQLWGGLGKCNPGRVTTLRQSCRPAVVCATESRS